MNTKEIFKKYWFVGLIAILFVCFIIVYIVQMIQNKPVVKEPKLVDGNYIIYTINGENYTADEFYDDLKEKYGMTTAYSAFEKEVVDKAIETTNDMKTIATNNASYLLQQYGEEELDAEMKKLGYENSKDAYDYYIYLQKSMALRVEYLKEHMEDIVNPFVNENHPKLISHILVKVADVQEVKDEEGNVSYEAKPTEDEQKKLDDVLNALTEGKTFAEVASQYSDDGSAEVGGSLGYFDDNNTSYVTVFADTARALKGGETSAVITSQYGYHIIYVDTDEVDQLLENSDFLNAIYAQDGYSYYAPVLEKAEELNIKFNDQELWNEIITDIESSKKVESEEE